MAVLVRMTAAGMDEATYDQVSAQLAPLVKRQPGFIMHVAYPSPGGFSVGGDLGEPRSVRDVVQRERQAQRAY
jgi:hypothetical protein